MGSFGYVSQTAADDAAKEAAKSARSQAMQEWRTLAEFLGIDPDGNSDAMSEATYYACLKILRETLGKMPLRLMRRMENGGIVTAYDHPLYNTLAIRPNPYMTASAFWAVVEQNRNHYGNAYVYMTGFNTESDPLQLWIMNPNDVEVWYDDKRILSDVPDIYYRWSNGGKLYVLKSCEVMHFRSSDSFDGIKGVPLIDRLGSLVEGASDSQAFQNTLIASGMTAKAVLQYTANLDDKAAAAFAANIEKYAKGEFAAQGVRNIIPLPVGATLQPMNIKLTDAQFMELKKYNAVQIASAFGIKPQQIGDMTKQSYASSQAQQEAFYTDTMLYILRHYEDEIAHKALTRVMTSQSYFAEFDTSVILRSDFKTTVEANKIAIESGQMYPNEARSRLKLPADPDGNVLLGNGNLIPIGMAGIQYQNTGKPTEGGE
jgi:HK97 family phage portal protein